MTRVSIAVLGSLALSLSLAIAAPADADPPLPAAMRAQLEQRAPIQSPTIYIPPAGASPARWIAFVGSNAAMSAWVVTPGGNPELARIDDWPLAVRVLGATLGPRPANIPGAPGELDAFIVIESLESAELAQPRGLRTIMPLALPDPKSGAAIARYDEELPWFAGVTDAHDLDAHLAAASAYYGEDADGTRFANGSATTKLVEAARTSPRALAKLIPAAGIAVIETWQSVFARETGRIRTLGSSPDVQTLRAALAAHGSCSMRTCNDLLLGVDAGHVVIRAIKIPRTRIAPHQARRPITANAGETQTVATGRALDVTGAFRVEAPLGLGTGTIGVVGHSLVVRDGPYASATPFLYDGDDLRFGDFDGDGVTDVVSYGDHADFAFGSPARASSDLAGGLELVSLGRHTVAEIAEAVLALPDDPIKPAAACALLATMKTTAGVDRGLAPGGELFAFSEPSHPGRAPHDAFAPAERAKAIRALGACSLVCDPTLPICTHVVEGPETDFFVFTHVDGKLRLQRAALYRGA